MTPSPVRYRLPWKGNKRLSEPDRWLDEMGFFRKHVARDSSCLFRAVSENVYNTQNYFHKVRIECIQFMSSNRHLFEGTMTCSFENYLKEMSNPRELGGLIEISAMSHLYRRDFVIFEANRGPQTKICNGYNNTIYLFYFSDTKHFDAVYTKEFINTSAFCQSLVYNILYNGVYKINDLVYAVDKMLHDKNPLSYIEYFKSENVERRLKQRERAKIFIEAVKDDEKNKRSNAIALKCKHHTEDSEKGSVLKESLSIFIFNSSLIQLENVCENCLNVNSAKDLLDNSIKPFPYKVAKALDPDIYRNIEFDVWSDLRKEFRYGARYYDGTTLQIGVKCLCKLHSDQSLPYHCHIQEMRPDGGPCLVFIEELGEKRVVSYDQLEPLPLEEAQPWVPPYRSRTRSHFLTLTQILEQIGNISRKQTIKARIKNGDEHTSRRKSSQKSVDWKDDKIGEDVSQYVNKNIETEEKPLMADSRPAAGTSPPENAAQHPRNEASPENNAQGAGNNTGDTGGHLSSMSVRASTPASTVHSGNNGLSIYTSSMNATPYPVQGPVNVAGAYGYAPYCKPVMLCSSTHVPAPPPPGVNLQATRSVQPNGSDLPMNDIATLRYFFNLGLECMWSSYGAPPQVLPRYYTPRVLTQDMQQMNLNDRPSVNHTNDQNNKQKQPLPDKHGPNYQGKGNGQRPPVGPRFKRNGNNHEGNQNNYHHQNKGQTNMPNRGLNTRRNSHTDNRQSTPTVYALTDIHLEGMVEQPLMSAPCAYAQPAYWNGYWVPMEPDPMAGAMSVPNGYEGYEEGIEYGSQVQHYYPAPAYPPTNIPPPSMQHVPPPPLPPNFAPQPNPPPVHNSHPQQNIYHHIEHK